MTRTVTDAEVRSGVSVASCIQRRGRSARELSLRNSTPVDIREEITCTDTERRERLHHTRAAAPESDGLDRQRSC